VLPGTEGLLKVVPKLFGLVALALSFVFSQVVSSSHHVGSDIRLLCLGGIPPEKKPRTYSSDRHRPLYACTQSQCCLGDTLLGIGPDSHSLGMRKSLVSFHLNS